jgi:intein/homing endonuclease
LKPIGELQLGDKVLAMAEWKERGAEAKADARLAYERITDIYTSRKEQVLVHLTLDSGEQLTATEGHPFKTSEGWRDAVLLKRGGKLLLKGSSDGDGSERMASIADVRLERSTVQVFNLEVANAHTFFVGNDGALVHNGIVYCRFAPPYKPYIGKADSWTNYAQRKSAHGRNYPGVDWQYTELYEGTETGRDLERVEQGHLDDHGGPTNKSNPDGGTANKRDNFKKKKKCGGAC